MRYMRVYSKSTISSLKKKHFNENVFILVDIKRTAGDHLSSVVSLELINLIITDKLQS